MKYGKKQSYVGLYGNVKLIKAWCENCQAQSIVRDGELLCCGTPIEADPDRYKRESEPEQRRRRPSLKDRQQQLETQDYKCFYCLRSFGSYGYRKKKGIRLQIHYDHLVPYALTQNNNATNFVAACHVCNGMKSAICFRTIEEAQIYLQERWKEKGYSDSEEIKTEE